MASWAESSEVRGEIALVVAGAGPAAADLSSGVAEVRALVRGGTGLKEAVTTVAQASGLAKNVLYEQALKMTASSRIGPRAMIRQTSGRNWNGHRSGTLPGWTRDLA